MSAHRAIALGIAAETLTCECCNMMESRVKQGYHNCKARYSCCSKSRKMPSESRDRAYWANEPLKSNDKLSYQELSTTGRVRGEPQG